jgi:endonuclease/exonuclease/phosphatase family metal-dependent hydrolase
LIRRALFTLGALVLLTSYLAFSPRSTGQTQSSDIVLYASEATVRSGAWNRIADSSAAGGFLLSNPDAGVSKIVTALSAPSSYFEQTFNAQAGKGYRLWIRGRAQGNSPYNDSVYVQFSGSVTSSGGANLRIGTTDATVVNLEDCLACGLQGWGWQDNGWGAGVLGPVIYFQTTGVQTIRIQPREDGLSIDQIVLSPSTYLTASPGALKNDTLILPKTATAPTPTPTPPSGSGSDVVVWASNVPQTSIYGNWAKQSNSSAAGQTVLRNADFGAAKVSTAFAVPGDYFDVNFNATSGVPYRMWIRGRADNDYWANDSVFAQFSDSQSAPGVAGYRIGTSDALVVNLEDCSGCGLQSWGWQDDGWGIGVLGPTVYFQSTGVHTLRIQRREDGISIDEIVLSPSKYLYTSPGSLKNDGTILPSTLGGTTTTNQPPQVSVSASPTSGVSPLSVSFSSSASDPDGYITSYSWTFGDGNGASIPNPTDVYVNAGTYTARLTVTDNAGASSSASIQITANSPVTSGIPLRVMSFNSQFGEGTDAVTNFSRTASWIVTNNADVVALCEMPPTQVSTMVTLMNQKTGRSWYSHFVPKYPNCPEGNLILSRYPIVSVGSYYLSFNRSVAEATISVSGKNISFFATHLDDASSANRYTEVGELTNWAANFAEPRIFAGDFNGGPDTSEAIRMAGTNYDSWAQAMNLGVASAYPDNPVASQTRTRRGRIDYVFYSKGASNLVLKSAKIPDSRDLNNTNVVILLGTLDDKGVRPSDHNQMIANFEIK